MSPLARSLEFWRERRGLSQARLSQKAGLADSAVNDIIRSPDRSPRLATLEALARALEISLWQLLGPPGVAETERAPVPPTGFLLVAPEEFSGLESSFVAELAKEFNFDPDKAQAGLVLGLECLGFGLMPGMRVAIVEAADYANEIVAVVGEPLGFGFRYCAPPWLIGFRAFGVPFHEFIERPGLTILGAVRARHHVETFLGRSFPPAAAHLVKIGRPPDK